MKKVNVWLWKIQGNVSNVLLFSVEIEKIKHVMTPNRTFIFFIWIQIG